MIGFFRKDHYKKIAAQIRKYPEYVKGSLAAINDAFAGKKIDESQKEALLMELSNAIKHLPPDKIRVAVAVIDLYDTFDQPLSSRQFISARNAGGADRIEAMKKIEEILALAKKKHIPIFATTRVLTTPSGDLERDNLSSTVHKYVPQANIFVKRVGYRQKAETNAFHGTGLYFALKKLNINYLIIIGYRLEHCIKDTIEGALRLEFQVITSMGLLFTEEPGNVENYRRKFKLWHGVICLDTPKEIEELIQLIAP